MKGRFVLISGSAGQSCPADKLDVASQFVRGFTGEVLSRGGAVVVLAGDEGSMGGGRDAPRVFDWLAIQEVERHANSTTERPRAYARVIMSDEARESKIDDAGLRLLRNLEQRNAVELCHIRREVFTGGEYRKVDSLVTRGFRVGTGE